VTALAPLAAREAAALMPTYRRYPVAFDRGEGTRLWDTGGREYLDFAGGIAVAAIGHAHPRWVAAVAAQAGRLAHVSNLFSTAPAVALAERLVELSALGAVFLANSGAEANEAALKLARRVTGRERFVAAAGGFHGRTFATLAATGQPEKHAPFAPLPGWFTHVPFGDVEAMRAAVDERTAAVILEPVLGEGGVVPAPGGYLAAAREICDAAGALLILDEVQTGVGRCGSWFAHQRHGVRPDVMTLAKALGGGLPIGACVSRRGLAFASGEHASTFGGNPVACAGALAVLDVVEEESLVSNAAVQGERLRLRLSLLEHRAIAAVRGEGLLFGVELAAGWEPRDAVIAALRRGLVLTEAGHRVVRFTPPLTVTTDEVDRAVSRFADALEVSAT
jgi:acetylornithine aminotransferase